MAFTREEARDWAEMIEEIREKAAAGTFDENDLEAMLETVEECIGCDAEAAGWYAEWEQILADSRR